IQKKRKEKLKNEGDDDSMCINFLDPKMDFIFKQIFGSENEKTVLLSFLNTAIKPEHKIVDVELRNVEITKEAIEDKNSRLDVKAVADDGTIINVEIQLTNKYNMPKRTLFYWSKLYSEQLKEGIDYSNLKKTICINIVDFIQFKEIKEYHSIFRVKEEKTGISLDDVLEIHFLELPKLKGFDKADLLSGWGMFLKEPSSDVVEEAEESIREIKTAKKKLWVISSDEDEREKYRMREKGKLDEFSAMAQATREGERKKAIDIAKNLIGVLSVEEISKITGLTLKEINELKKN
ncbi:MAG: Rpn family recombination-promoting nuclease/putative transposase, partial [Fusobacteriaceae bacterium]